MTKKHTTASIASEFCECFFYDKEGKITRIDKKKAPFFVGDAMVAVSKHDSDHEFVRQSVWSMLPDIETQAEMLSEDDNISDGNLQDALDAVANANTEEMNQTLFDWLAADIHRQSNVDEALGDGLVDGDCSIAEIVKYGYRQQQRNIAETLIETINAERDERNAQDEEQEEGGDND